MGNAEQKLIFIVEDNVHYSKTLSEYLSIQIPTLEIKVFKTGEASLHEMNLVPIVVILDYYLDSELEYAWNGIQILNKILLINPAVNIIIISARHDAQIAANCINQGAFQYVIKDARAMQIIKNSILNILDDAKV